VESLSVSPVVACTPDVPPAIVAVYVVLVRSDSAGVNVATVPVPSSATVPVTGPEEELRVKALLAEEGVTALLKVTDG
jgi:hypothetical protein